MKNFSSSISKLWPTIRGSRVTEEVLALFGRANLHAVPRAYLRFVSLDIASVEKDDVEAFIYAKLGEENPGVERERYFIVLREERALCWINLEDRLPENGWRPVTLLQEPTEPGIRLVRHGEGEEFQHWAGDNLLLSSVYSALSFSPTQLTQLIRMAGESEQPERLNRITLPLRDKAWATQAFHRTNLEKYTGFALWGLCLVAAVFCLAQYMGLWRVDLHQESVKKQVESLTNQLSERLTYKSQALNARQQIDAFLNLLKQARQMELMAAVSEAIKPIGGGQFERWQYDAEQEQVNARIRMAPVEALKLLEALQTLPTIEDVRVQNPQPSIYDVSFRLVSYQSEPNETGDSQ